MKTLFLVLALLVTTGQFASVARADAAAAHAAAGMPLPSVGPLELLRRGARN